MKLNRGDVVTVAVSGDSGKPRPVVIVQSDVFPEGHRSTILCPLTSTLEDAPDFRIAVPPSSANGLLTLSRLMVDKHVTVRRERIGSRIGRLDNRELTRLNRALAFVLGLAD